MTMLNLFCERGFSAPVKNAGGGVRRMLRRFFLPGLAALAFAVLAASAFPGSVSAQSVSLSVTPSSITEEGGTQTVTVSASTTVSNATFCIYVDIGAHTASQQTATEGTDYAAIDRKLLYFNGSFNSVGSVTFNVVPTDDSVSDGGETIRVHSWKPGDQSCKFDLVNSGASTTLTLNDSDPKANLSVSPTEISENSGATVVTVTAALNLQGTRTLGSAVEYAVSAGKTGDSATQGTDYTTAGSLTITLPSGTANAQATGTFTLTPGRDLLAESDETITVRGVSTNDGDAGEATITLKNSVFAPCTSQSTENLKTDCRALEALYNSAGGADWKNSANWKIDDSLDRWHGVKTKDGRVSEIELYENQLTGTIPSDIANLSDLIYLDLGINSLSGDTPDLSSLDSLGFLRLDGNNLGGTMESIGLDSMDWLEKVHLQRNSVSGTVPEISSEKLVIISLNDNKLSGTLDNLASSTSARSLRELNLSNNNISGTIPDLSGLKFLRGIHLADNSISGTMAELSKLAQRPYARLLALDLGNNKLSGVLPDLGFLASGNGGLNILSLHGNSLSGEIPDLSSYTNLSVMDLASNSFSGEIGDLGGSSGDLSVFDRLYILDVSGNRITGEIPVSSKLPGELEYLQLSDNDLTGSVPNLSGFTKLRALGLWGNPDLTLTGITLPSGVTRSVIDWAALWALHYKNGGSGWTSSAKWLGVNPLGQWHGVTTDSNGQVTALNLRYNNMSGNISGSVAALEKLVTLNLSCNSALNEELPLGLKDISTLTTVNICSTGMTAPTDSDFTTWKNGITFTDGTCSPACPAPVSQQSSPPPVEEEAEEQGGSVQGGGNGENEAKEEEEPVVPADGDTEAGGCALVSGEASPGAGPGLLLFAAALLAASRMRRRGSGRIQGGRSADGRGVVDLPLQK